MLMYRVRLKQGYCFVQVLSLADEIQAYRPLLDHNNDGALRQCPAENG